MIKQIDPLCAKPYKKAGVVKFASVSWRLGDVLSGSIKVYEKVKIVVAYLERIVFMFDNKQLFICQFFSDLNFTESKKIAYFGYSDANGTENKAALHERG
jgi:hypothetical protein